MPTLLAGEYWLLKRAVRVGHRPRPLARHPRHRVHGERPAVRGVPRAARPADRRHREDRLRQAARVHGRGGRHVPDHVLRHAEQPLAGRVSACCSRCTRSCGRCREPRHDAARATLCCGFFAALAATFELPAAAFLAALGRAAAGRAARGTCSCSSCRRRSCRSSALFACNYAATRARSQPAYGEFGGPWYNFEGSHWSKCGTPPAKGHRLQRGADDGLRVPPAARAPRLVQPDAGVVRWRSAGCRARHPQRRGRAEAVRRSRRAPAGRRSCSPR